MVIHRASHFKWNAVKLMNASFLINWMCFLMINIHSFTEYYVTLSTYTGNFRQYIRKYAVSCKVLEAYN